MLNDFILKDIQVEAGPQDGTLLVTWQAVTRPPSSGPVTGYAVYADGKKVRSLPTTRGILSERNSGISNLIRYSMVYHQLQVTDVDSPTGDHALIDIGKLVGLNPRAVTVRTKSRDSTSGDSQPTLIPSKYIFFGCTFISFDEKKSVVLVSTLKCRNL